MKLDGKTNDELVVLQAAIVADPANRNVKGGIYLYTSAARRKLDAITRQITHNLAEARAARGDPVDASGYSGRQSKRRR